MVRVAKSHKESHINRTKYNYREFSGHPPRPLRVLLGQPLALALVFLALGVARVQGVHLSLVSLKKLAKILVGGVLLARLVLQGVVDGGKRLLVQRLANHLVLHLVG